MQTPISLKMSATWENEKSSSSIVPRICNLSITQVLFDRILDEKIENNQFFHVTVRMRDSSRRVLRSPELAFPMEIPGVVNLNFHCSIQYSHALKRDSSNLLQLLIQRKKKYKKKPVNFGYKTLAYCTIDLAQVLQRKIENRMLDLYEDPKSLSNNVGRIEVQSLTSTPAEKVMLCERRKEFYEEDDEGIPDQFSEDSDHGEDSDFDPNCAEFGESRQKKIMKAMAVGQKQIKQKIMGLLKKVKLMEHNEVPDPRDRWWDELDQFENISDESDICELDSLSIQSTPRPVLKPFFNRNTLGGPQNAAYNATNNLGGVGGMDLNGHMSSDQTSSEDTLNRDGAAKLFKKLQLTSNTYGMDGTGQLDNTALQDDDHYHASCSTPVPNTTIPSQTFQITSVTNTTTPNTNSGGARSFSIMKKYHPSTGVVSSAPLVASSSAGPHQSNTTAVNQAPLSSSSHFSTDNILSATSTSGVPGSHTTFISPITCQHNIIAPSTSTLANSPSVTLDSTSHQGSKHKSAIPSAMPNNPASHSGGISAISGNATNQKHQKKIPPISGFMKTLSLSSSNPNGENFSEPMTASTSLNDSGGICGGVSPSPSQQLQHPFYGNTAQPSDYGVCTTTSSPISNAFGGHFAPAPFTHCNESIQIQIATNIHDIHPRPELIEQADEFLNTLGSDPDSTNIIYLISLSDVGGKYVSDLFKKEYTPHLNLASYADTKYAFTQIVNKMRKRTRILKLCLLGGDCHLNNVLRAFIYQMNENYATDVLSKFRFFVIPIIGLYLASSTSFPGISISGVSATSNTMAKRLCALDPRYNSLFSEFLQTETPTLSTDSGSERDNKFLFGVHDYLQAGSSVVNCPIGECLVSTKDKHQNILQDLESTTYNEAFIPFITEIRIGGDIPLFSSSLTSTSMLQDLNASITNTSGAVATSSNSAVLGRMDSSANEEQLLAMMSNTSSPPRSPVITVTSGFDGSGSHIRHPAHHHQHSPLTNITTSTTIHQQQSASLPSPAAVVPPSTLSSTHTLPQSSTNTQPSITPLSTSGTTTNIINTPSTNVAAAAAPPPVSSSPLTSSAPLPGHNPEMQLEYWTGDHSSSKKLNIKTAPLRQVLVHTNLTDPHHLSLTILTKEKKQKIIRIAKKPKHDTGDMKKEVLEDINQIFCTSKNQSSEIKVIIDGVVWSNVHFFQIGPSWRTNIKTFPIATFF